jgi:hypothetical protein
MRGYSCSSVVILLFVGAVSADVDSGPEVGKKVPALKVYAATGDQENKTLDYAAERNARPTIYIFIQADKWSRPMARFLKSLEKQVQKDSVDASVVAVWLTDTPDKAKQYLPVAQQSLQFEKTVLTLFKGERSGPKDWGINLDAHATVVVANKGKVAARFGYLSINATDVPSVRAALKKTLKSKRTK